VSLAWVAAYLGSPSRDKYIYKRKHRNADLDAETQSL